MGKWWFTVGNPVHPSSRGLRGCSFASSFPHFTNWHRNISSQHTHTRLTQKVLWAKKTVDKYTHTLLISKCASLLLLHWQHSNSPSRLTRINAVSGNYNAASRLLPFMYHCLYIKGKIVHTVRLLSQEKERERGTGLILLLLFIVHHSAQLSGGTLGKSQMNPLIEPPAPDIYSLQLISVCVFVPCLLESVTALVLLCTCVVFLVFMLMYIIPDPHSLGIMS